MGFKGQKQSLILLLLVPECQELEVIMKNDVLRARKKHQGIYQLGELVNGRPTWKNGGTNSEWGMLSTSWIKLSKFDLHPIPYRLTFFASVLNLWMNILKNSLL